MKKIIVLSAMAVLFVSTMAYAGCRIGANFNPGNSINTEMWYNPDGIANNGDEILGASFGTGINTGNFLAPEDCATMPNVTVYVKGFYAGGVESKSNEMVPEDIIDVVLSNAAKLTE